MRKSLSRIYDEFADSYDQSRGMFDMSEVFETFFQDFEIDQGNVLDLGCGAGEPFATTFIKRGWTVTGVDFSKRMLELATKYAPEMRVIHDDMRHVEFRPEQFDAVTIIYALFHLPSNEHEAMFEKIFNWLRPQGKLLFTYATQEYTGQPEFDGYLGFMGRQLYYGHKNPDRLYTDLEAIGFDILSHDFRNIGGEIFLWVTASKPA